MNTQITTEIANAEHIPDLIELGRTYYPPDSPVLARSFLEWLYLDNPDGAAPLVIAREGDKWIGLIALIPVMLEHAGRLQRATYAVNVLTHPEHRGKKLFVEMIQHAQALLTADGQWLLGHPSASATPGWTRQAMEFRDSRDIYVAKLRPPFSPITTTRITTLGELRAIPEAFWGELAARPDVHVRYTPEFFAWRFLDAPHKEYVVSAVEKRGEFLGLTVAARRFKGPFDLLIDFVGPVRSMRDLIGSGRRLILVAHPTAGSVGNEVAKACWKLPVRRQLPFFATTWDTDNVFDMTGISLSASDI